MRDKLFICQRCQSRVRRKTPECEIGFEWTDESFKSFKKEAEKVKDNMKIVLTSCLGPCPKKKISYQELAKGKMKSEGSYSAKSNLESIFKNLIEEK